MTAPAVYGARTIKAPRARRVRRTREQVFLLDEQIKIVLDGDHPQSIRHVFYRMTDPRWPAPVEKSDKGYRDVQHRIVQLRRSGRIPYNWISDMTRRAYLTPTFGTAAEFIRTMAGQYRADLWREAEVRCEVWVESRSIASVLIQTCKDLAVGLFPCGGFSSISFAHEAAEEHNQDDDRRPLQIFYIGDYDPAGVLIDRSLERELRLHLRADIPLRFTRLGINAEQVERFNLPGKPRKNSDRRARHIQETVEAEALPAAELRAIVRSAVERLLPAHALRVTKVAEQSERGLLKRVAEILENPGQEAAE
jgi:hypothetical protein